MNRYRRSARAIVGVAVAACQRETLGTDDLRQPMITTAVARANPTNVLSAVVTTWVLDADSVAVRVEDVDDPAREQETPAVSATSAATTVPVLGLLPAHRYVFHAVARTPRANAVSEAMPFTTDTLPADLPQYIASGPNPTPGFVVFAAGRYGLVIDNSGRVVWYRRFPNGPGLTFAAQPSGHYYARPAGNLPSDAAPWMEMDALGNAVRTVGCANGLVPRFHDLVATGDDTFWLLCDDTREMNLTAFGGAERARVTATDVQRVSSDGRLLFNWSPFDHFDMADANADERAKADVNWTHGNSLDLTADGNLLVSYRNLGEITKINSTTGAIMWRLGGRRSSFAFADAPAAGFLGQHSVRAVAPGTVLLLDNVGDSTQSRGERYILDERAMTARLAASYGSLPGVTTPIGGSVQDLPNGHTLVSFGTAGRVEEYDASGSVVWHIERGAGYVFRAQRIRSLYAPGEDLAR